MVPQCTPSAAGPRAFLLLGLLCVSLVTCSGILASTNGSLSVTYSQANGNAPAGAVDLSLQSLARSVYGVSPDQIHVTFWGSASYLVSWATGDGQVGPGVVPPPAAAVVSCVLSGLTYALNDSTASMQTGIGLTYVMPYSLDVSSGPGQSWLAADYASPILHHVLLEGLLPKTTYYYQVGDPRYYYGMSAVFNFTTLAVRPPNGTFNGTHQLPFRLGIVADMGQTANTTAVMARMMTANMDALALAGDFTYADHYGADGCVSSDVNGNYYNICPFTGAEGSPTQQSYQPRWDTWARLWQTVLAGIPILFTNGNHEIEQVPSGARFTAYNARYPAPPAAGVYPKALTKQAYLRSIVQSQSADNSNDATASFHNMFSSVEVPGATIISLTSYIGGDTFAADTLQYKWLQATLAAVDRVRTPWVLVQLHSPLYTTDAYSYKGMECFRLAYEPLMYQYGVDVVFSGHVHRYERSNPVYNLTLDTCGIVHLVVGDGGNLEEVSETFIDDPASRPAYCAPGKMLTRTFSLYQPQACFSTNPVNAANLVPGQYCDTIQPLWSAYRNPSFGFGVLEIQNATSAYWVWDNTDGFGRNVTDSVYLTRNLACANKGGDRR